MHTFDDWVSFVFDETTVFASKMPWDCFEVLQTSNIHFCDDVSLSFSFWWRPCISCLCKQRCIEEQSLTFLEVFNVCPQASIQTVLFTFTFFLDLALSCTRADLEETNQHWSWASVLAFKGLNDSHGFGLMRQKMYHWNVNSNINI